MEYSNHEVMAKLEEFFNKQDPKLIARIAASFSIDLNRFLHFDELEQEEKDDLIFRTLGMCESNMKLMNGTVTDIGIVDNFHKAIS